MYIILTPLFAFVFYNRIKRLGRSIKRKNSAETKMNVLFLVLILLVSVVIIALIERMRTYE